MEESPNEGKTEGYFIENPQLVTVEDMLAINEGDSNFLNNFHRHIGLDTGEEIGEVMNEAINEIGFDLERFNEVTEEMHRLVGHALHLMERDRPPYGLTSNQKKGLSQVKSQYNQLNKDVLLPLILPLYKKLREKGIGHYQLIK